MSDQSVLPQSTPTETGLKFAKVLVWLVYAYFVIAIIILVLEFFLLLFNASTDASFTQWVYRNGDRVMEPFRGIFPAETAGNGSVIDFGVLFAIIMYGIVAMLLHGAISWIDRKIGEERQKAHYIDQVQRQQAAEQRQAAQRAQQQQAQQPQQPPQ
ncbi:MAG: YggT family protein [Actinomycetota bacterium]